MGNRLPLHILSAATVLLFAATACTRDDLGGGTLPEGEYPLVIRATGLQAVATPASTRATVDGDWQGVQTVALSVGGTVKEYDVTASDTDGYKTAILSSDTDPFWWTSREDITVSAWWPYGTTMPDVVVKKDQSTKEGFEGSDFISAEAQAVQFDHPMLEFSHRTARITVLLKPGDGIPSVTGANVSVTGLGTDNGNPATIRTYAAGSDTYEARTADREGEYPVHTGRFRWRYLLFPSAERCGIRGWLPLYLHRQCHRQGAGTGRLHHRRLDRRWQRER